MEAKDTSHIGMIVGAICLLIAFGVCTYKLIINDFALSLEQAFAYITMGCAPGIPFCPIYISTWIDKVIQLKKGVYNDAQ